MPCRTCADAGMIPCIARASIADVRHALDDGAAALCGCPQGQWWLSMIYAEYGSMLDRNRVEIGNPDFRQTRGVPPGMLHGTEAVAWLEKDFIRTSAAMAQPSSLGASAALALAGLIGAVPASLQSATWHGPSFSPANNSSGALSIYGVAHVLAALMIAVPVLVHCAHIALGWLCRGVERLSAVDDPAERQAD